MTWHTIAERSFDLNSEDEIPRWQAMPGYDLGNAIRAREDGRAETMIHRIPHGTRVTEKLKFKVTG